MERGRERDTCEEIIVSLLPGGLGSSETLERQDGETELRLDHNIHIQTGGLLSFIPAGTGTHVFFVSSVAHHPLMRASLVHMSPDVPMGSSQKGIGTPDAWRCSHVCL